MRVLNNTSTFDKLGDMRAIIKLLQDSGCTAFDFSMFENTLGEAMVRADDYLEQARSLRAYIDELGFPCNQAHAPYPSAKNGDDAYNRQTFSLLIRSIEVCGILGVKNCVVHPCNDWTAEENAERIYLPLAPYARKVGVKIAVENMWNCVNWGTPEFTATPAACSDHLDFKKHMELLPTDAFVACVDIGHSEMGGLHTSAAEMLETLGDYVQCIHLHDVDLVHDNHTLPFFQKIDYTKVIAALKKIGYTGDITLEANNFIKPLPVELYPEAARFMAAVANYFKEQIEKT